MRRDEVGCWQHIAGRKWKSCRRKSVSRVWTRRWDGCRVVIGSGRRQLESGERKPEPGGLGRGNKAWGLPGDVLSTYPMGTFQGHVSIAEPLFFAAARAAMEPPTFLSLAPPRGSLEGRLGAPGRVIRKCGDFRPDPSIRLLDCMILRFSGDNWAADVCPNSAVRHMRRERGVGVGVGVQTRWDVRQRTARFRGTLLDPMHRWMATTGLGLAPPVWLDSTLCSGHSSSPFLCYIGCDQADARNV